jgi:hypothetical protein
MAEMSNHEKDCIPDDLPPLPLPYRMHRQKCGVVGGVCIIQGCTNYYPHQRECQTCDSCAERHCACRSSVQHIPRPKRQHSDSDYEYYENKRIRSG